MQSSLPKSINVCGLESHQPLYTRYEAYNLHNIAARTELYLLVVLVARTYE